MKPNIKAEMKAEIKRGSKVNEELPRLDTEECPPLVDSAVIHTENVIRNEVVKGESPLPIDSAQNDNKTVIDMKKVKIKKEIKEEKVLESKFIKDWRAMVDALPRNEISESSLSLDRMFTRNAISSVLGGNTQSTLPTINKIKFPDSVDYASNHQLCP